MLHVIFSWSQHGNILHTSYEVRDVPLLKQETMRNYILGTGTFKVWYKEDCLGVYHLGMQPCSNIVGGSMHEKL